MPQYRCLISSHLITLVGDNYHKTIHPRAQNPLDTCHKLDCCRKGKGRFIAIDRSSLSSKMGAYLCDILTFLGFPRWGTSKAQSSGVEEEGAQNYRHPHITLSCRWSLFLRYTRTPASTWGKGMGGFITPNGIWPVASSSSSPFQDVLWDGLEWKIL